MERKPATKDSKATSCRQRPAPKTSGFTLIEVLITTTLLLLLIIGGLSAIAFLHRSTARMADYTAAVASVQGRMEAVRAASYNPPVSPYFTNSTVFLTNVGIISAPKSGTNYIIGTNVTEITPSASGHLVTVTGTFAARGAKTPLVVTMQSFVNQFSGGQQ